MIRLKNSPLISGTQFVAIVVLTISIFLVVDFGRRTTAGYYVSQAEKRLKAEIQAEHERQAALKARLEYVDSDAYVEEWARDHAHMIRPGDRPLFLVTPDAPETRVELIQSTESPAKDLSPNWYRWWLLFFDEEPKAN